MPSFSPLAWSALAFSPFLAQNAGNAQYVTAGGVGFNGYDLNDGVNIICQDIDTDDLTKVDLSTFDFPQTDGGGVLSKYYRGRQIKLKLHLKATTAPLLDTLIDTLKKRLKNTEGIFSYRVATDETRLIPWTVTSIRFDRNHYNVTFIQCDITIQCSQAFFTTVDDQSVTFEGKTGDFTEEITHNGNATTEPTIYLTFTTASTAAISFTTGGVTITPNTTLASSDILIINSRTKQVTKNGVAIDYQGTFPTFEPWVNSFTVDVTAGSATYDITVSAPQTYL